MNSSGTSNSGDASNNRVPTTAKKLAKVGTLTNKRDALTTTNTSKNKYSFLGCQQRQGRQQEKECQQQHGIRQANTLYQIRRPLGLVFVIYFWWLGDLLPLYI